MIKTILNKADDIAMEVYWETNGDKLSWFKCMYLAMKELYFSNVGEP